MKETGSQAATCQQPATHRRFSLFALHFVQPRSDQLAKISPDVIDDPALTRSDAIVCPSCEGVGGVVIQAKTGPTDDKIKLIFVCKNRDCTYKWQE